MKEKRVKSFESSFLRRENFFEWMFLKLIILDLVIGKLEIHTELQQCLGNYDLGISTV